MSSAGSALWRTLKAYQVYGANTDVGKTIISTILCRGLNRRWPDEKVWYLKPVSTGPLDEADNRHISRFAKNISTQCLFQFKDPVSPHIAARDASPPSDQELITRIHKQLSEYSNSGPGTALVETAGGVHSPGPNGTSQLDLYRPLRLPVVLIADSRLGGISSSVSAFESLHIRGYDVASVVLFQDDYYQNAGHLKTVFGQYNVPTFSLQPPPERKEERTEDQEALAGYYENSSKLDVVEEITTLLSAKHKQRIEDLDSMAKRADTTIWYPFTQHHFVSPSRITPIDSAYDDYFQTYTSDSSKTKSVSNGPAKSDDKALLQPTFDGSASWWTQGLGHGNPSLVLAAAHAAGRYGHVMFPEAIHEPALDLAEKLLRRLENPRLTRVFYSDNGSTGTEIAIKMGLRAACVRYGWDASKEDVGILGLKGSYHGDTIGAMDCSDPSPFNLRVEWYRGRGYWFDYPTVKMTNGVWVVDPPPGFEEAFGERQEFSSLDEIFDVEAREQSKAGEQYKLYIYDTIHHLVHEGRKFGALLMEPVILGAGGMFLVDPLFQRTLVNVVRSSQEIFSFSPREVSSSSKTWTGLPTIFDEVFTGLYRLGRPTSASFLGVDPDISVHAKLLTGGLIPLCATVASESVFEAFVSADKTDALLHGHSYTAHAVGCEVARKSLKLLSDLDEGGTWQGFKDDWATATREGSKGLAKSSKGASNVRGVWSAWSKDFVTAVSCSPKVSGVIALGSVLAIRFRDETGSGYTSTASYDLREHLRATSEGRNIHSRVLGDVLYLMAAQTSTPETLGIVERSVRSGLRLDG